MSDYLETVRQALERTLDVYAAISEPELSEAEAIVRAAARRFLALTETLEQLREAIENEGPHPKRHDETYRRHRTEWPTLWAAIDQLRTDYLTEEET